MKYSTRSGRNSCFLEYNEVQAGSIGNISFFSPEDLDFWKLLQSRSFIRAISVQHGDLYAYLSKLFQIRTRFTFLHPYHRPNNLHKPPQPPHSPQTLPLQCLFLCFPFRLRRVIVPTSSSSPSLTKNGSAPIPLYALYSALSVVPLSTSYRT